MAEVTGRGITVDAEVGGRRITLDPIKPTRKVEVEVREVENSIPCGFRQSWLTGGDENVTVELDSQAGCGGKWLIFTYKKKGEESRSFLIDTGELVELLIENAKQDEQE